MRFITSTTVNLELFTKQLYRKKKKDAEILKMPTHQNSIDIFLKACGNSIDIFKFP